MWSRSIRRRGYIHSSTAHLKLRKVVGVSVMTRMRVRRAKSMRQNQVRLRWQRKWASPFLMRKSIVLCRSLENSIARHRRGSIPLRLFEDWAERFSVIDGTKRSLRIIMGPIHIMESEGSADLYRSNGWSKQKERICALFARVTYERACWLEQGEVSFST